MHILRPVILTFLLLVTYNAHCEENDHHISFNVREFSMNRRDLDGELQGLLLAKYLFVKLGEEDIILEGENGDPIAIRSYILKNRFYFKKDFITISTPLASENPLVKMKGLHLDDAELKLTANEFYLNAKLFDFAINETMLSVENSKINCDPKGKFTTNLSEVCLKNSTWLPLKLRNGNYSYLKIIDSKNHPTQNLDFKMKLQYLKFTPENIKAKAREMKGLFLKNRYNLKGVLAECYKDPNQVELDPIGLVKRCLYKSNSRIEHFDFETSTSKGIIHKAQFNILPQKFSLKAHSAVMRSNNDHIILGAMNILCQKEKVDPSQVKPYQIIDGCLQKGHSTLTHITLSENSLREFIQLSSVPSFLDNYDKFIRINNFKNLLLKFKDYKFQFKSKLHIVLRLNANISGHSELNKETGLLKLTINKATIGIFSAKDIVFSLIKKFIISDRVKIKGDTVLVQL